MKQTVRTYYQLAKPGIIYGNALTAIAGFMLAAQGHIDWALFVAAIAGLSLVIASACVSNNILDKDIDTHMARTKKRALATGEISERNALVYAVILGLLGGAVLGIFTNLLTLTIALTGWIFYVIVYGYFKRHSVHGTVVGSISGAVPPVVGYVAVTGRLDLGALLLFIILVCWQMPHFYAIAMNRSADYAAAGIPVLPVKSGPEATRRQILLYIVAFGVANVLLTLAGYTGVVFAVIMLGLSGWWLRMGIIGWRAKAGRPWAKKMFLFSLIVITVWSVVLSLSWLLP